MHDIVDWENSPPHRSLYIENRSASMSRLRSSVSDAYLSRLGHISHRTMQLGCDDHPGSWPNRVTLVRVTTSDHHDSFYKPQSAAIHLPEDSLLYTKLRVANCAFPPRALSKSIKEALPACRLDFPVPLKSDVADCSSF
jgi:hypothetical protein